MNDSSRAAQLCAQRLAAQALSRRADSVDAVLERLLALQAQDLRQAGWALGVRTAGATRATIDTAFAERRALRTWCMRGTLHVLPAADLPWLIQLLGPRNLARAAGRFRQLEISEADLRVARAVVERELVGRTLSRDALFQCFEAAGQRVREQRGVHLLFGLSQAGLVCQVGEPFALAAECTPPTRVLAGDEALVELGRRYLVGHGPATHHDLAFWSGLGKRDAKRAFELAGPVEPVTATVPGALFLPGYDEYLLGYEDRSACIEPAHFERVVPGGNGVFQPMVVVEGRVRATWSRSEVAGRSTLVVRPFERLTRPQRALLPDAAYDYGVYVGEPSDLHIVA